MEVTDHRWSLHETICGRSFGLCSLGTSHIVAKTGSECLLVTLSLHLQCNWQRWHLTLILSPLRMIGFSCKVLSGHDSNQILLIVTDAVMLAAVNT